MKKRILGFLRTNRQGLALISVLGVVTLATILILALFSVSDAEFKAARNYADGTTARQLADTAVNMVISQIQAGATGAGVSGTSTTGANRTTWASQPGAIRVYRTNGEFVQGRRLYSSDEMVVNGTGPGAENRMAKDAPDSKWNSDGNKAVWVDLNQPVVRATTTGRSGTRTIFPILDPKAFTTVNGFNAIEGFSYSGQVGAGQPDIEGVVSSGQAEDLRVPMPVRWLYILKDGTMGTVSSGGAGGVAQWDGKDGDGTPSESNPIIGRVAFWTDDESCRLNINTAGEPGNFATPSIFHARDSGWSNNQPTWREYQRYPGHPATVSLSSVLAPNPKHDLSRYDNDSFSGKYPPTYVNPSYIGLKDTICTLVPKLSRGGSADGTRAYVADDFNSNVSPETDQLRREYETNSLKHLFMSVDEWIFANQPTSGSERALVKSQSDLGELLTPDTLERSRFFLSANSRAPELNMFGLPRVAIWPVPDASLGVKYRTGYDSSIAYASSLASQRKDARGISLNSYYFSRRDSESAIEDIGDGLQTPGLNRNRNLMAYLEQLISVPQMPGGGTFSGKYGKNDSRQILVEIFDYIRSTNLYDAFLDKQYTDERPDKQHELWDDAANNTSGAIKFTKQQDLWYQRPKQGTYYTYTAPRFDTIRRVGDLGGIVPTEFTKDYSAKRMTTGAYPGHGQVRPIEWTTGGQTYKGFGRFPTISEVSLHFICTADGDMGGTTHEWPGIFKVKDATAPDGFRYSGGRTAKRVDPRYVTTDQQSHRTAYCVNRDPNGNWIPEWWYSNLPPFPSRNTFEKVWGCDFGQYGLGGEKDPLRHPGSRAMNWNGTLERDSPLLETQKQIQVMFQIEMFVPSLGYTKYTPDFSIVLAGDTIGGFEVDAEDKNGNPLKKSLFETTRDQTIQSTTAYMGSALGESVNSVNVTPLGGSYGTSPLMSGRQVKAPAPMPNDPGYVTAGTDDPNRSMLNFPLVSNPFTVNRNKDIVFRAPKTPIEFDIYAAHDRKGKNATPSQKIFVKFEDGKVPVPYLVVYSAEHVHYVDGNGNQFDRVAVHAPHWWAFNSGGALQRWEGRVGPGGNLGGIKEHTFDAANDHDTRGRFFSNGNSLTKTWDTFGANRLLDVPSSVAIYGYSPLSTYAGVRSNPVKDKVNADRFQDGGKGDDGKPGMGNCMFYGTDSVRSMVPDHGDYRLLAARPVVNATAWVKHRVWQERPDALFAHSLMGAASDREAGVDIGDTAANPLVPVETNRMVSAWYQADKVPDTPLTAEATLYSQTTGDFDTGVGDIRDGAYINKADDGNVSVDQEWYGTQKKFFVTRNSYFKSSFLQFPSPGAYFTPNRQVTSPVMFGSLPTGVYGSHGSNASQTANGVPWRTLLFRPDNTGKHYGNGVVSPADHNILDLFWMPTVEPYAISDSYASAGKINMNYQMVPFLHITRATGMHAVLKNELVTAFSKYDAFNTTTNKKLVPNQTNTVVYKRYKNPNAAPPGLWGVDNDPMEWHRRIAISETLKQFDERFAFKPMPAGTFQGLFRTASQICEINMIPRPSTLRAVAPNPEPQPQNFANESQRRSGMANFWAYNNLTGENLRERTYSNIYQKVTTRSNTFRVYFLAQAVKKAKSVKADEVDLSKDTVTGEYRGTALIDRFLDFSSVERAGSTATPFPDYADGTSVFNTSAKPSMETLYHYRILEMKQFSP